MRVFALGLLLLTGMGTNCFAQSATAGLSPEETQFVAMINQFRLRLNLPRLDIQPILESVSRAHSVEMAANDRLSHYGPTPNYTPFQRMADAGYGNYYFAGENIACGNGDAVKTFRQWAFSPGHLQNMINPHFHEMGIARAGTGNEYCHFYWTNDFGSYVDPSTDPVGTTDLNLIAQAIAEVSGPIPPGTSVSITEAPTPTPSPTPSPTPTPPPVIASPVPVVNPAPTATPIPYDAQTIWQRLYAQLASGGVTASVQVLPVTSLQCLVPYALGKGILTYYQSTDTFLEASGTAGSGYSVQLSFYQNGVASALYSVSTDNETITSNPDFPIVTLFSAPGSRVGGYIIQVNTRTNQAQFDSYGITPGVTGSIMCNIQH
jgi:hypothetical protein